jgi:hypothetical protein
MNHLSDNRSLSSFGRSLRCVAITFTLCALASCRSPHREAGGDNTLRLLLEAHGYALYTPFRSSDMPGSFFVIARDHFGHATELSLASTEQAFKVAPARVYNPDGQIAGMIDNLGSEFSGSGSVGVSLASLLLDASIAADTVTRATITLVKPKKIYRLELAKLAELRDQLSEPLRKTLKEYRDSKQLQSVFVVVEVLQVSGLKLELVVESGVEAKATADKLSKALTANATLKVDDKNHVNIDLAAPMLIGYKAITVPTSLLDTAIATGTLSGYVEVTAEEMNGLKD